MVRGNLLVFQSGGPTAVVNTTAYAIQDEATSAGFQQILVAKNGLEGILRNNISPVEEWSYSAMQNTPGAFFGTTRYRVGEEDYELIFQTLDKRDIRHVVFVGGNGSAYVAYKLIQHAKERGRELYVIGASKTMDNDIQGSMFTPGYLSAAKSIISITRNAAMDSRSISRSVPEVVLIETWGREAGWVAAATSLLYELDEKLRIYVPERPGTIELVMEDVDESLSRNGGSAVVVMAESFVDRKTEMQFGEYDVTANGGKIGSVGNVFERLFVDAGLKVQKHVPRTALRSDPNNTTLLDRYIAELVGRYAVRNVVNGKSGFMTVTKDPKYGLQAGDWIVDTHELYPHFAIGLWPLDNIAFNRRQLPDSWINERGNGLNSSFVDFLRPYLEPDLTSLNGRLRFHEEKVQSELVTI